MTASHSSQHADRPILTAVPLLAGPPRGTDQLITSAIGAHVQDEQRKDGEGPAEVLTPAGKWHANGTEDRQLLSGDQGARS
jgi:hypothetical protein